MRENAIMRGARKVRLKGLVVMARNVVGETEAGELYLLRAGRWLRLLPARMSPASRLHRRNSGAPAQRTSLPSGRVAEPEDTGLAAV
jgi:hypothetical protein